MVSRALALSAPESVSTAACPDADGLGPDAYVADASDCDDTNSTTSPSSPEICDGGCSGDEKPRAGALERFSPVLRLPGRCRW